MPGWANLLIVPGLIAGFTIHELAHACVAYFLGDVSQVERGRITLNPFRHISWLGLLTFFFFGFGWAKTVRVDARHFKRRYPDIFLVSISGSVANLALAGVCLGVTLAVTVLVTAFSLRSPFEVLRSVMVNPAARSGILAWAAAFTTYPIYANLALAFFNLLPLPGLDGFAVLASLLGWLRRPALNGSGQARAQSVGVERRDAAPVTAPGPTPPAGPPQARRQAADIHFERGATYHTEGKYEDAIARYRQALDHDQHHGPAYVNLGLAYLALGQRNRAIHAFRGASQYASDERSRNEAWAHLHKLSQFPTPDVPEAGAVVAAGVAGPWTNAHPAPNWAALFLRSLLLLLATGCVYVYLTIGLIRYFS
jgi:Zn-dependent protease